MNSKIILNLHSSNANKYICRKTILCIQTILVFTQVAKAFLLFNQTDPGLAQIACFFFLSVPICVQTSLVFTQVTKEF